MNKALHLAIVLFLAAAGCFAQAPKVEKPVQGATGGGEKLRDMGFSGGVDLQFLLKELMRDMDVNVLFDPGSRLERRRVRVELRRFTKLKAAAGGMALA